MFDEVQTRLGIEMEHFEMNERVITGLILSLTILIVCSSWLTPTVLTRFDDDSGFNLSTSHTPHASIQIDGNEELIAMADAEGWQGDGSTWNPYLITGYEFTEATIQPIRIWNTDLHWELKDNIVDTTTSVGVVCGMWIDNVVNGKITNNTIRNRHSGLVIIACENIEITGNSIYNNSANGAEITGYVENIEITGNSFVNNGAYGIYIQVGNDITILGNSILNSRWEGLRLGIVSRLTVVGNSIIESRNGVQVVGVTDGNIAGNSIIHSSQNGILIDTGNRIDVTGNTIMDSDGYGVHLDESARNVTVDWNSFLSNGENCQVCDDGEDNVFIYNYFDDWTTPDEDSDNLIDESYEIEGAAQNADPYPRADPSASIPISPPIPAEPIVIPIEILVVLGALIVVILVGGVYVVKRGT